MLKIGKIVLDNIQTKVIEKMLRPNENSIVVVKSLSFFSMIFRIRTPGMNKIENT